MIDFVLRPLAGLVMCLAFGGLILTLPTAITRVREWLARRRQDTETPEPRIVPQSENTETPDRVEPEADGAEREKADANAPERKAS